MSTTPAAGFGWPPPARGPAPPPSPAGAASDFGNGEFRAAVRDIFNDLTAGPDPGSGAPAAARHITELVRGWAQRRAAAGGRLVSGQDQQRLARAVYDKRYRLGAIQPYLDNPDVENIDINGPGQVVVRLRGGRVVQGQPVAGSDTELEEMVRTWGIHEGQTPREFSISRPMLNASLRTGIRLAAVMGVTEHVHVSIRCHRLADITLSDLAEPDV